ncbi:MAG: protein kinase [Planctomycetales bacterium]|nr:protein kinase [Planctomycetales bacterium]
MASNTPDVHTIFNRALELESSEQREQFLNQICADHGELRQRVEQLLNAHQAAGAFLGGAAANLAATEHVSASNPSSSQTAELRFAPGTRIGNYKLREQLAEGGMGVVYVAEQTEPVRRKVALKVIKPGMSTRDVVARFEAERQALALMDHPNIARVIDGGSTESGQPYFVMELVQGLPLTQYCDNHKLTTTQRLQLFMKVCRAVQHAHQKGIIHRDLKPSNVLVAEIDDEAVPKVIDFGVAKALHQKLSEQTVYTQFSQMIGTPLYMSPEQVGLGVIDVDTRSDVYSLGAMLYEVLTGHTPFDSKTLKEAGYDEMRRIIREQDPPRPSTMISTLNAESRSTIAECRQQDPRKLREFFARELDWIVMKALEKDRNRRYESSSAFAADVERYLNNEPVMACPPSTWYRLSKLARRHHAALLTVSVVALGLIVGIGVATWQAVRATRAEAREKARLQLARSAVDEMYTQVAEEWLSEQGLLTDLQRKFLEKALRFYEEFAAEANSDPQLEWDRLRALERVGHIQIRLGQITEVNATFMRLSEEAGALAASYPDKPEFHILVSVAMLRFQHYINNAAAKLGEMKLAAQAFEKGKSVEFKSLNDLHWYGKALFELSGSFKSVGLQTDSESALMLARRIFEQLLERDPRSWEFRYGLAMADSITAVHSTDLWYSEIEITLRQVDVILCELLKERPDSRECRETRADVLLNLGVTCHKDRKWSVAENYLRDAIEILESLVVDFPDDTLSKFNLTQSITYSLENAIYLRLPRATVDLYWRRFELLSELAAVDDRAWLDYFPAGAALIDQLSANGDLNKSQKVVEQMSERLSALSDANVSNRALQIRIASFLESKAALQVDLGDHVAAAETLAQIPDSCSTFSHEFPQFRFVNQEVVVKIRQELDEGKRTALILARPAVLFQECAKTAQKDETLSTIERQKLVEAYTSKANAFQTERDTAIAAWAEFFVTNLLLRNEKGKSDFPVRDLIMNDIKNQAEQSASRVVALKRLDSFRHRTEADVQGLHIIGLLRAYLSHCPQDGQLHWMVEYLTAGPMELRDSELALEIARRAVELAPNDMGAKKHLAWAVFRAGDWNTSLELLNSLDDDSYNRPFTAMSLWQLGREDEAAALIDTAYEVEMEAYLQRCKEREVSNLFTLPTPDMVRNLDREARDLIGPDREEMTRAYFNQDNDEDSQFLRRRSRWHLDHGRVEDSLTDIRAAAKLVVHPEKSDWELWNDSAIAYYRARNWQGAELDANLAIELSKERTAGFIYMAPLLLLAGKEDEYHLLCVQLMQADSGYADVRMYGLDRLRLEDPQKLVAMARRAFENKKQNWVAYGLARALYRAGEYDSAIELLTIEFEKSDVVYAGMNALDLAIANKLSGRHTEAKQWLQRAVQQLDESDEWAKNGQNRIQIECLHQEAEQLIGRFQP